MVLATNPHIHEESLEFFCQHIGVCSDGHASEIKFSSTDKRSLECKRAFIDYFCACPDLEFRCIVRARNRVDLRRYKNDLGIDPCDLAYNHTYRLLLENNLSHTESVILHLDQKSRTKTDNLDEYLRRYIEKAHDVEFVDSKHHRLVQLADLLTGCVNGDITNNEHHAKRPVIDYLKGARNLPTFSKTCQGRKFNVWHWNAAT